MVQYLISAKELQEDGCQELRRKAESRGLLHVTPENVQQLLEPDIPPFKDGTLPTFEQLWPEYQSRFTPENIDKINLLYYTTCRGLVLHNVHSKDKYTLAEELKIESNRDRATKKGKQAIKRLLNIEFYRQKERESKKRKRIANAAMATSECVVVSANPIAEPRRDVADPGPLDDQQSAAIAPQSSLVVDSGPINVQQPTSIAPQSCLVPSLAPQNVTEGSEQDNSDTTGGAVDDLVNTTEDSTFRQGPFLASVARDRRHFLFRTLKRTRISKTRSASTAFQPHEIAVPLDATDEVSGESRPADVSSDEDYDVSTYIRPEDPISDDDDDTDDPCHEDDDIDDVDYRPGNPVSQYCGAHECDNYGVIKPHVSKQYCDPNSFSKASERLLSVVRHCGTLDKAIEEVNEGPLEGPADGAAFMERYREVRKINVKDAPVACKWVHLPLGCDFKDWDTLGKLQKNVSTILKSRKLLPGYIFHFRHAWPSKDSSHCFTVHFECANARRFTVADGVSDSKACLSMIPLECEGNLYVRVYLQHKLLVFKHMHKHHCVEECETRLSEKDEKRITEALELCFSDDRFVQKTKNDALKTLLDRDLGVSPHHIECRYEQFLKKRYCRSTSDWLSTKAFYDSHQEEYATFVIYQEDLVGLAVFLREVIALLPGNPESVAVDSTHGMSHHKCEYFAALATIDRTGILVGSMFIGNVKEIYAETSRAPDRAIDERRPLPQCQIAQDVDFVSAKKFPDNPKTALLSSFFLLLKGTNKKLCVDVSKEGVCRRALSPITEDALPPDNFVLHMASEVPDPLELAYKKYSGLDVDLITCDKDKSEIMAVEFAFPEADVSLCLWHGLQSLSRAIPNQKVKRYSLNKWFGNTRFPPGFALLCPRLFSKHHKPGQCPNENSVNPLDNSYRCIHCFPDEYANWDEPILRPHSGNSKTSDTEVHLKYGDLIRMYKMHERAICFVPQTFPFLNYFGPKSVQLVQSPGHLCDLILREMLEFCLSRRLLYVFRYLWTNWYCEYWINKWTQIFRNSYNVFTTNMICEAFNSVIKRILGSQRCSIRLDRLVYALHVSFYPRNLNKLKSALLAEKGTLARSLAYKQLKLSWIAKRWKMLRAMIDHTAKNQQESTSQFFVNDVLTFRTNPMLFVCGCAGYKLKNIHMCVHIMRCLDPQSYDKDLRPGIKFNLRASNTPPFYYAPTEITVEQLSIRNAWPHLRLHSNYIDLLASEYWHCGVMTAISTPGGGHMQFIGVGVLPGAELIDLRATENDPNLELPEQPVDEPHESIEYREIEVEEDVTWMETIDQCLKVYRFSQRTHFSEFPKEFKSNDFKTVSSFHKFSLAFLKLEVKTRTTRKHSTVSSRKRVSELEASFYRKTPEERKLMLQKVIASGLLTDDRFYARDSAKAAVIELLDQYGKLANNQ